MDDSFSQLARKIRLKKLKKEDIENLKKEAIESKIERNRRQKKAIEIQRIIRGFLARKKYKILEDRININTIIDYLYEKKLKRIHRHSSQIISYFIYKYIYKQRNIKIKLINEFKIHCSDLIKAFIRGIILRKKIKNDLESIRNSKKKISPYIISYKTRLILKSNTLQNILADIANIKFLLQDEKEPNENEEDKQYIKELKIKLRKKYHEFYLLYYQNKISSEWIDDDRISGPWLKKYQQIINGEDISYIKKNNYIDNNINYDNLKVKEEGIQKKLKNVDNNTSNNEFNEYDFSKNSNANNLENNYNDEYSNTNINENYENIPQPKKQFIEDNRPIKPLKNNNFINSENPFGLGENGFPEDHTYYNNIFKNNNNQIRQENKKSRIKRNKDNKKQNNNHKQLIEKEEEKQIEDQENILSNNINNFNTNINNKYNNYDDRPISKKKIDYNAMFGEGQNYEGDGFGGLNQETNSNPSQKKIIKHKNSSRKKPIYDARKAIEEAKLREAKEGKKEKPSAFREFVKEMKKMSTDEKASQSQNNENNPTNNNNSFQKIKKYGKDDLSIKNNNYLQGNNFSNNLNYEGHENLDQKIKKIPVRGRRETKDMIKRRKLHELERSPPPILNLKGVKSKIECWGPSNNDKRQRISQYNIEKENKKIRNLKISKSDFQTESKRGINMQSINKNSIEISQEKKNKEIDPIRIEEKAKKIALKKLAKIEKQINRIDTGFNLENYFKEKERKMIEYGKIPYIKKEYNYVKKYSNEVYSSLVTHLMAQYQDLK